MAGKLPVPGGARAVQEGFFFCLSHPVYHFRSRAADGRTGRRNVRCRKKARAFPIAEGQGDGKDLNVFGNGVGNPAAQMVREKAGSGNPKTDPVLVLDGFKFMSLICHQLTTASICWLFC